MQTVAHLWKRKHFYLYGTITTSLLLVLSYCKPFSGICVPVMNGVERTQVCWPRWTSTWLFNTVIMPFTTYLLAGRCGLASEQVCDKSSSYPRGCVWVCVCFPLAGTWSCCGTFAEQVCFASLSCLTFSIAGTGNPETLIARPMVHTNSRCHCTIAAFLCHCALVGFSYNKREKWLVRRWFQFIECSASSQFTLSPWETLSWMLLSDWFVRLTIQIWL